jgi:protein-tyrosine phosphatase
LSEPELAAATAVFVMETKQRKDLLLRYPQVGGKVFLLGQWQQLEIADPIGQPREIFEVAWRAIDAGVRSWVVHLHKAGLVSARNVTA